MTENSSDVVIVGGGVIGCAVAYVLAGAGRRVTLLEKSVVGAESSGAAAGILAPRVHATDPSLFALAMKSHALFPSLTDSLKGETGLDSEYVRSGVFDLASDEASATLLRDKAETLRASAHAVAWLSREEVLAREPSLTPENFGAFFDADAYHINPARFTLALARAAARRGVKIEQGVEVTGLLPAEGRVMQVRTQAGSYRAEHVVLAAGAWSEQCSRWLGVPIPVYPARGQILTVFAVPSPIEAVIFGWDAYLLPRVDGTIVVGATVEEAGFDKRLTVDGLGWLLGVIPKLCPSLAGARFERAWAGLRPRARDELPIVGRVPGWDNVVVATGHFRNGIMLAPVTAQLVAGLIGGDAPDPLLGPLSLERFRR